jgi:putative membrane protein
MYEINGYGGWGNMMGWFGGGIIMILFWAAVIYFIIWFIHKNTAKTGGSSGKALNILKERYAKGEIDKLEFEEMKKNLD